MKKIYKILPQIKLRYFKRRDSLSEYPKTQYTCFRCGMKNVPFIGAVRDAYSSKPTYFCENCAIDMYMNDYGFGTREVAASWRRRIFDVGYLFTEIIFEKYTVEKNKTVEDLSEDEWNRLSAFSNVLYNSVSKKKKEKLEAIFSQDELEKELKKIYKNVPIPQ